MNKTKNILKTSRLPNLIMLAVVQFIVSYFIVVHLSFSFYFLIATSTISIALGGYILNDIQDIEIDKFNNKLGIINDSNKRESTILAIIFHIIGLALGFYVCTLSSLKLFPWFIGASMALVAYAFFLSKFKIIGNFLISGLIALAILLCYYLVRENPLIYIKIGWVEEIAIWSYAGLGFLINWIREVCKDIEDVEGDRKFNRQSLPIFFGIKISKLFIAMVLIGLILMGSLGFIFSEGMSIYYRSYISMLFLLSSLSLFFLIRAKEKADFRVLSAWLKILMLVGIFFPVAINVNY